MNDNNYVGFIGDEAEGTLQLAAYAKPPLEPGEYLLTVSQKVSKGVAGCEIQEAQQSFQVQPEQIFMNPDQVYSFYPPGNTSGAYDTLLPHIILKRGSFAWERVVGKAEGQGEKRLPWVALLVFSEEEEAREIPMRFSARESTAPGLFAPRIAPDWIEEGQDCRTVEIPARLFAHTLPHTDDLEYLAHMRKVSLLQKVTDPGVQNDGWFCCVTANRYPRGAEKDETGKIKKEVKHLACLVSLEGFAEFLSAPPERRLQLLKGAERVRMYSLFSWEFYCRAEPFNFYSNAKALSAGPLRSYAGPAEPRDEAGKKAQQLMSLGYYPVNQQFREGSRAVSWYHSPLYPKPPRSEKPACAHFADELLRFDAQLGMFDITFSAAWQLGRLLALQNESYAASLMNWRLSNRAGAAQQLNERAVRSVVRRGSTRTVRANMSTEHAVQRLWKDYAEQLQEICGVEDPAGLKGTGMPVIRADTETKKGALRSKKKELTQTQLLEMYTQPEDE